MMGITAAWHAPGLVVVRVEGVHVDPLPVECDLG
jgi:hypothetical protein